MSWNPFKAIDRVVDKGSNVLHNARDEFKDTTRAVRRTASSAANTVRREVGETSQAVRRTTNNFANTARREFNETTQAASRTTNRAVNTVRREVGETSQAVRRTSNNFANTARREFNETTQAARRTSNNFANTARREFNETTQAAGRTTSRAVNTARREFNETTQAVSRTSNNFANTARREFNETTQAVSRTTNNFANTARQVNLSDVGHTVLDGAGFIPVVGGVADLANAGWYAAKGDKVNAALSAASAIPFAGDAFAAGKLAYKAGKGAEKLVEAGTTVSRATNVADKSLEGVGKKYTFDTRTIAATPGKPLASHQRKNTWRAMAEDPKAPLTEAQRQHIRNTPRGKSPAPTWDNPVTGRKEIMELSHEGKSFSKKVESGSARREHGTEVVPRWKETHVDMDDFRHFGRKAKEGYISEKEAYTSRDGIDKIRKAFAEEVKEWGYKIDDSKL